MKTKIILLLALSIFFSLTLILMDFGKSKAEGSYFLCFTSISLSTSPIYKAWNEKDIGSICTLLLGENSEKEKVGKPGFDEEEDEEDEPEEPQEPEEPEEDDAKVFIRLRAQCLETFGLTR